MLCHILFFFFFNDTATTEIYTLSLHDALPISLQALQQALAGRYVLDRPLGRGGMGMVYLAREVRLERPVAVKLLPPAKAAQPAARERFLREARTADRKSTRLNSSHGYISYAVFCL